MPASSGLKSLFKKKNMKRLESVAIWLVIVTAFAAVTITLPFYFVAGYLSLIMEPRNNV